MRNNMDKYRVDSHKLMYHVKRVSEWLDGKLIYPIYIEISPSGTCNHRCVFCGMDFMGYEPKFLDTKIIEKRLSEMGRLGVKSIMYAGEGEPLLHKDIIDLILATRKAGIDVALTTNGVLLDKEIVDKILGCITWIKVSIDAGTKETHSKIHGTNLKDFDRVIENLRYAVKVRGDKRYETTIGTQFLLLPDNWHEAELLAQKVKDIGVDYLLIKPYSQHFSSNNILYKNVKYSDYLHLSDTLEKFNDEKFNVIFRKETMERWDEGHHRYEKCLALPFWAYIDAGGNVCGCFNYLGNEKFHYGNINEDTFEDIWTGEKRIMSLQWVNAELETSRCRVNCRMDKINEYLWSLKHPIEHVNFI